jgi:hypothetical protein
MPQPLRRNGFDDFIFFNYALVDADIKPVEDQYFTNWSRLELPKSIRFPRLSEERIEPKPLRN